jgi:hypothetical protein
MLDAEGNFKRLLEGKAVGEGTQDKVDPTVTPKTVEGEDHDGRYHGIYRFGGEMLLETCTGPTDRPPPTEFTSQPGSGHVYAVWKRVTEGKTASDRPSAERAARRAQVLALVMYRASLEQLAGEAEYEALHGRLPEWIDKLDLASEIEPAERKLLLAPLGKADPRVVTNSYWRNEGLGVLAWGLKRFELPRHDENTPPVEAGESVGFNEDLLDAMDTTKAEKVVRQAELRPAPEIDRFACHVTIVHWRLRNFKLRRISKTPVEPADPEEFPFGHGIGEAMDFAGYLRAHPSFKESWLNGLPLVDGDLEMYGKPIGDASRADVDTCASIAVERQIAAYWLQGDARVYSEVDPATVLTGLGGGPAANGGERQP